MPLNKRWAKIVFTIRKCTSCRTIPKKHFSSSPYSFSQSVCLSVVWIEGGVVKCLDILWVTQLTMTKISFEVFLGKISKNLWPWNIPTIQNSYVHSRGVTPQPCNERTGYFYLEAQPLCIQLPVQWPLTSEYPTLRQYSLSVPKYTDQKASERLQIFHVFVFPLGSPQRTGVECRHPLKAAT